MLLKRNVFRIVCALFYLPVALLSMFEIINLVMKYIFSGRRRCFWRTAFSNCRVLYKTKKMVNYCRE